MFVPESGCVHKFVDNYSWCPAGNASIIQAYILGPAYAADVAPTTFYENRRCRNVPVPKKKNNKIPLAAFSDPDVVGLSCSWNKTKASFVLIDVHN